MKQRQNENHSTRVKVGTAILQPPYIVRVQGDRGSGLSGRTTLEGLEVIDGLQGKIYSLTQPGVYCLHRGREGALTFERLSPAAE